MKHPATMIRIGDATVRVDTVMVPLIQWLNSLPGVVTEFSCQGVGDLSMNDGPAYVLFTCRHPQVLVNIFKTFCEHEVTLEVYPFIYEKGYTMRYSLKFYSVEKRNTAITQCRDMPQCPTMTFEECRTIAKNVPLKPRKTRKPAGKPTAKDHDRVLALMVECRTTGRVLPTKDMTFLTKMMEAFPEWYKEVQREAFIATVPFGSNTRI
jgi:hypothetical protein